MPDDDPQDDASPDPLWPGFRPEVMRDSIRGFFRMQPDRSTAMRESVEAARPVDHTSRMRDAINPAGKIKLRGKLFQHLNYGTIESSALSPSMLRRASASLSSIPVRDLTTVWAEAVNGAEDAPATESAIARLQLDVPSLSPTAARWFVMCFVWLVVMGLLSTWTTEHTEAAKDVNDLYGLNPALVATALAVWSGRAVKKWQDRDDPSDDEG